MGWVWLWKREGSGCGDDMRSEVNVREVEVEVKAGGRTRRGRVVMLVGRDGSSESAVGCREVCWCSVGTMGV